MRILLKIFYVFLSLGIIANTTAQAGWDPNAEKDARKTIALFKKKDSRLQTFFDQAYGYAVFPTVGKGALWIGGAHGNGVVFKKGNMIGYTSLTQLTIGLQLGGQAYSEVIFFKDKKTLDDFKKGNFELSAQASAIAATEGAAAHADYSDGIAIFTMEKGGLMFEASVGGQKFSYEAK